MRRFNPGRLIRPNIANLNAYTPILPFEVLSQQLGRDPAEIVKLDANENPYGPSPRVIEALAAASHLHIYPDPESRILRSALADYTGVDAQRLLVGHGADELIDLVMRLVIEPGDTIVNCPPTFGMYAFDAGINDATVLTVWRNVDFSVPVDDIEALFKTSQDSAPAPKLIFVTSPNNPDGSLLSDDELKRLLALPAITILDEAYIEFGGCSRIGWVEEYSNLIVLRTFSKWAGLAGLRVGYGAFPLEIMSHMWKIKQPYNVNVAGQIAAFASLQDRDRLLDVVAQIVRERERLASILKQFHWLKPYPSHANFVLFRVDGFTAEEVRKRLAEQGILVRHYNSPRLVDHIRISVGTPEQTTRLVQGLQKIQ